MNVIPAIDLKDGKCVRLLRGDFDKVTRYSDDPVAVAREFEDYGTTDLHIVDLDGARTGDQRNRDLIARVAASTRLAVQVGGGIRDRDTVAGWLDSGISRCVVGSLAVTEPRTVRSWIEAFGIDRIVLALDVRVDDGNATVTTQGWTASSTVSVFECLAQYRGLGPLHVLCTDVSRDGAMAGPNIALYEGILERFPELRLQASGGVRDVSDLVALRDSGIPAAITGRALLDGRISPAEMVSFRQSA